MVFSRKPRKLPPYYRMPQSVVNNRTNSAEDTRSTSSVTTQVDVESILNNYSFGIKQHFFFGELQQAITKLRSALAQAANLRAEPQIIEAFILQCTVELLKSVIRPHDPISAVPSAALSIAYFLQEAASFPNKYQQAFGFAVCRFTDQYPEFQIPVYLLEEHEAGRIGTLELFEALEDLQQLGVFHGAPPAAAWKERVSDILLQELHRMFSRLPRRLTPLESEKLRNSISGAECQVSRTIRYFITISRTLLESNWIKSNDAHEFQKTIDQRMAQLKIGQL